MEDSLDHFSNLDQLLVWAETRDPRLVRIAAHSIRGSRTRNTREIDSRDTTNAASIKRAGRDIDAELWAKSGWAPPDRAFVATPSADRIAQKLNIPTYQATLNWNVRVRPPIEPKIVDFVKAWMNAPEHEQELLTTLFVKCSGDEAPITEDPIMAQLPPSLSRLVHEYLSRPEIQGPPHVLRRDRFPTLKYLEHLFRTGRLVAKGNLPNDPRALDITKDDWGGLEIACGGDFERLAVWRIGGVRNVGRGDFENVRVARADVLREFPAGPPGAERGEGAAVKALAAQLTNNGQLTKAVALGWCRQEGFEISQRQFQAHVWPEAREKAGLARKGASGRKQKSLR